MPTKWIFYQSFIIGPISVNIPDNEEHPGPPFNQSITILKIEILTFIKYNDSKLRVPI